MPNIYDNICPADCFASCRIKTIVEKGRAIRISGDPEDIYTNGSLCAKGYAHLERIYSPERVLYPLRQKGKGLGQWERITWEDALGEIAERLVRIRAEEHSMFSVCLDKYLGNTGILNRSVEGFFRSIGYITFMVGSPCDGAGMDALILNYGACRKSFPEDMTNAKLIVIWGANPAWTVPHQMRFIYDAVKQGAKLVVIDPIFTATAARSDLYIQIRPGADGHLASGIAKVLLDENLCDEAFLEQHTHGWDEFKSHLLGVDLDCIAKVSGIGEKDIREIARLYGTHKPVTTWLGVGAQHNPTGGQNLRVIDALAAMTGNIGIPGGNVHYVSQEGWAYSGAFEKITPPCGPEENQIRTLRHRTIGTGRFAELQSLSPPIRFLWIAGRNPVSQDPDASRVREILKSIETVVVVDQNLTSSAAFADYFLPVKTFFEYEDVVISNWHFGASINQQAIKPIGECRSDFEIVRELARTLNRLAPDFSTFPVDKEGDEWIDSEMQGRLYSLLGITHFKELLGKHCRLNLPAVAWEDRVFPTPSGRYEFSSAQTLNSGYHPLPIPAASERPTSAYPFQLLSVRSFAALNSQFRSLKSLQELEGTRKVFINPLTAKARNIAEGKEVSVYNWLGEIHLKASLTDSVPPDLLVVYVGMASGGDDGLNRLISFEEADLGTISSQVRGISFQNCYVNLSLV